MNDIVTFFAENLTPLVANVGALAIVAWIISIYSRKALSASQAVPDVNATVVGVVFGSTAALLMFVPIEMQPGIFGDGRGGPILLSGIVGGPVAALITAIIAGMTRFLIGGAGYAAGVTYVILFALFGVAYWYAERRQEQPRLGLFRLFVLATAATILSMPTALLIPPEKQIPVLVNLWPILWVCNVVGTVILGALLERERERVKTEYDLSVQYKLAEQATVAKSRFLAAMSHEIRTPLNAVLGVLQLIDEREVSKETFRKFKVAHDSGQFLLSLINQVLDFARIEANAIETTRETFTVSTLLDSLHSIFKTQAAAKDLELHCHVEGPDSLPLIGSFGHIRQILFNYLGNAVKFTDQGSVTMRCVIAEQGDGGVDLTFSVMDTGPGISEADQELVFAEFGQVSSLAKRKSGTGLGLSISRELARAMGGEVSVKSSVGEGATFSFQVTVEKGVESDLAPDGDFDGPVTGLKILVAEDNQINQMIVRSLLEKDEHDVTIVVNGLEAIEAVDADSSYDLILMDIQMPEMDGMEATAKIREKYPDGKSLPIIAQTANAFSDQRDSYLAAGMQDVVVKPIDASKLQQSITDVMRSRQTENAD